MTTGATFAVLGPLEVQRAGSPVAVPRGHQRALLALLVLNAGESLSRDRLIGELWGEQPPPSAVSSFHVHMSKLRRLLEGLVVSLPSGYLIERDAIELDVSRFESLLARAKNEPDAAPALLREALALFRGEPLCDVACEGSLAQWRRLLEERRKLALLSRIDADLSAGQAGELVGELEQLAEQHGLEERATAQLMLALYRAGRQADALNAYERLRLRLDAELALQPGVELRDLHRAILNQDASLTLTRPRASPEAPAPHGPADPTPSSAATQATLPQLATPTFGRDEALEDLLALISRQEVRVITLVGIGGVGKTRLALLAAHAAAARFVAGACWVDLAGLPSDGDVAAAIVQALGLQRSSGMTSEELLMADLADRELLLALDNFEHVLGSALLVSELHRRCARLTVLVTSREPLDLGAEHCFVVEPLALPAGGAVVTAADIEAGPASALFLASARRRDHRLALQAGDPAAVARICARLEGLPLSLELAAARTVTLSLVDLADALDAALDAVGSGPRDAPSRHRTLEAMIDWSFQLLEPELQRVFVRFAVFAGGATIEAAIAVTGASRKDLDALVSKSLIARRQPATQATRLVMLDAVREHAARLLSAQEDAIDAHRRHLEHHTKLAATTLTQFRTPAEAAALAELEADLENAQAARTWALAHDPEGALRLSGLLADYWSIRRDPHALEWLDQALHAVDDGAPALDRARVQLGRAWVLSALHRPADSLAAALTAVALFRQVGDDVGISSALSAAACETGSFGEPAEQLRLAREAVLYAERAGDERALARALAEQAWAAAGEESATALTRAAAVMDRLGLQRALFFLYGNVGYRELAEGRIDAALGVLSEARLVAERLGTPMWLAMALSNLGLCEVLSGKPDRAARCLRQKLEIEVGQSWYLEVSETLVGLAGVAALYQHDDVAARLLGASAAAGYPPGDLDQLVLDQLDRACFAAARDRIGAGRWDQAYRTGRSWAPERAAAYALEWAVDHAPALRS